jgi:UDPglucose--hexose-1-phosphate uridylyltransferase
VSGRQVVIAPGRARRPGAARGEVEPKTQEELDACPFCAGREHLTPPETLRLPADGPWAVRVVPNKYPAFERHEIAVHSPNHVRSIAELDDPQLELVAEAWQRRRRVAPEGYLFACLNEGRGAGASLPHSHSQLVWLSATPPAVAGERNVAAILDGDRVLDAGGVVAVSPVAAREPYELRVAPEQPEADAFSSDRLGAALQLLAEAIRRLGQLEGSVPLNAWLHTGAWWHFELVPRLTVPAGLELGAELYVNPLPPEEAAARLRGVSP